MFNTLDKNWLYFWTVLFVVILGIPGFYGYRSYKTKTENSVPSTANAPISEGVFGTGEAKVEQVPLTKGIPVPDLNRPVVFSVAGLSPEAKEIIRQKIDGLTADLKENSGDFDKWLMLGVWRKGTGDYEGAKEAWQYVIKGSPDNSTAYSNLGDLYQYYLKDYAKSENYLKKAILLSPDNINNYRALYTLYTGSYKEKISEVPGMLKDGLKKNPDNYDLLIMLASYYKDTEDKTNAIIYYNKAVAVADSVGQSGMKQALLDEIKNLGQ